MSFYTNRGQATFVFVLGCEESRNPAKKGRENELITFIAADWPRMVTCWALEESPNPAKKGRENEFVTLAADWPRMVASWICEESSKSSEEGEREYV
jgi:hypothetical protein